MKPIKIPVTPSGIERSTFQLVAQFLPIYASRRPCFSSSYCRICWYMCRTFCLNKNRKLTLYNTGDHEVSQIARNVYLKYHCSVCRDTIQPLNVFVNCKRIGFGTKKGYSQVQKLVKFKRVWITTESDGL